MARDLYAVLEVQRGASPTEVKAAYRELAKRFHPDRHHSSPEHLKTDALARFKEISEAYEILGDAGKRSVYDVSGRSAAMRSGGASSSSSAHAGGGGYSGNPYHGRQYTYYGRQEARYTDSFFRQMRRGMTPQNLLVHGVLLGTLLAGTYMANHTGQAVWESKNTGRNFSDLRTVVHSRKREAAEARRQEFLERRRAQERTARGPREQAAAEGAKSAEAAGAGAGAGEHGGLAQVVGPGGGVGLGVIVAPPPSSSTAATSAPRSAG
eukprot:jgi/Tetstr1/457984/TSEL_044495.t1